MKQSIGILTAVIAAAAFSMSVPGNSLPDSSQSDGTVPAPSVLNTLQVEPARLPVEILFPLSFQAKDGILTLTAPFAGGFSGKKLPPDPVFWSKPFAGGSLQFTLAATDQDETLRDDQGQIIWSKHFEKPGLTLTIDAQHKAVLTDLNGAQLWQGQLIVASYNHVSSAKNPFPQEAGPASGASFGDVDYRCTKEFAILENKNGDLLWSGRPSGNTNLLIRRPQGQDITGVNISILLPPQNEISHIEVSSEPWTATLSDQKHKLIAQGQLLSMTMHVSSEIIPLNDTASIPSPGPWPVTQRLQDIVPPSPGTYYADYHDAQGNLVQSEKISAVDKQQKLLPGTDSETIREITRIGYDKLGHMKFHAGDGALVPKNAPASASNLTKT